MPRGGWVRAGEVLPRIALQSFTAPRGEGQTRTTLQVMARLAARSAYSPAVVAAAVDAVRSVSGRDTVGLARELEAWGRTHLAFLPDPLLDGDFIRTPDYMLAEVERFGVARGDCDDAAVLMAALGLAIGLPARIRAVAFTDWRPFEHVWTELGTAAGWIELDPTREEPIRHIDRSLVIEV